MEDYRQLSIQQAASILKSCAMNLLPAIRAHQSEGLEWNAITNSIRTDNRPETQMALYSLQRLWLADWLEDKMCYRLAGLGVEDFSTLAALNVGIPGQVL